MFADNSSMTDSFVEVNLPDMQTQTDQNVMTEHKQLLEMMERTAKMADVKLKIQPLKGADEWPEFKFRLEVFSSTMGFEDEMKYAETEQSVVVENRLNQEQKAFSKILYNILLQSAGPAFGRLRILPKGEGFRAWNEMCKRYQPMHGGIVLQKIGRDS